MLISIPNVLVSLEHAYYRYIDKLDFYIRDESDALVEAFRTVEIMKSYRKQLMEEGLDDETIEKKVDDVKNNRFTEHVGLDVSYDIGWEKKSSGRRYDSKSGHAFMIGLHTGFIIGVILFCKDCAKCVKVQKRVEMPLAHRLAHRNCSRYY